MATKAMAIRAIIVAMIRLMGRFVLGPMPWMPMSSRGIQLIPLRGANQVYLVIMSSGLTKFSQN